MSSDTSLEYNQIAGLSAYQLKIRGIEYSNFEQNSSFKSYPDYEFSRHVYRGKKGFG